MQSNAIFSYTIGKHNTQTDTKEWTSWKTKPWTSIYNSNGSTTVENAKAWHLSAWNSYLNTAFSWGNSHHLQEENAPLCSFSPKTSNTRTLCLSPSAWKSSQIWKLLVLLFTFLEKTTVCLLSDHFYKMPINNKQASQVGPQVICHTRDTCIVCFAPSGSWDLHSVFSAPLNKQHLHCGGGWFESSQLYQSCVCNKSKVKLQHRLTVGMELAVCLLLSVTTGWENSAFVATRRNDASTNILNIK